MVTTTVVISTITSAVVSLIVLFLRGFVSGSVRAYFDKQLEAYKADLRRQSDTDLERERARLRVLTESFISRASRLAETRLDRLVKLYELIVNLEPALERYVNPMKVYLTTGDEDIKRADATLREAAMETYREFYNFVPPNRIFLDDATCEDLDAFFTAASDILREYGWASQKGSVDVERWTAAHEKARNLLAELRERLRKQIGRLIGVEGTQIN